MKIQKYKRLVTLVLILSMIFSFNISISAQTVTEAPIYMNKNIENNKTQVLINDQFTVNYRFQPQDILATDLVPAQKPKEIVLVLDTSGSMSWDIYGNSYGTPKRMDLAKNSAKAFLLSIKNMDNVKVGIVSYAQYSSTKSSLVDVKTNYDALVSKINALSATGSTNIGDAMVRGYKMLEGGNSTSEKYFIFLTDGAPNVYTYYYQNYVKKYYYGETGKTLKYSDSSTGGLTYAQNVGAIMKNSAMTIDSHFIAFADQDANNKLEVIATAAGGRYKKAMTGDALQSIYEELGDQISSDFSIKNVFFQETFPAEFEIVSYPENMTKVGNTIKGEFGSMNYNLNTAKTHFVASPKEFQITLKAKTLGEYTLGANNSSLIQYVDLDDTARIKYFEPINISVTEALPPVLTATLANTLAERTKFTLTINIDEIARLDVYQQNGTLITTKLQGNIGSNTFNLTAGQLTDTYIKLKATDVFGNITNETVSVISLISLTEEEVSEILLQTQKNSVFNEIKVNGIVEQVNKFTDANGQLKTTVPVVNGSNEIIAKVTNEYGNVSTRYFVEGIVLDEAAPIITTNVDKTPIIKDVTVTPTLPVYVESDGTGSDIVETHYIKLAEGVTTATVSTFDAVLGTSNQTLQAMTSTEVNSKFPGRLAGEFLRHEKFILQFEGTNNPNGYYAIYAKDRMGNEAVKVIYINNFITELPKVL